MVKTNIRTAVVLFIAYYLINLLLSFGQDVYIQNFENPFVGINQLLQNWTFRFDEWKYTLGLNPFIYLVTFLYQAIFLHTLFLLFKRRIAFIVIFIGVLVANSAYLVGMVLNFVKYYSDYSYFFVADLKSYERYFSLAQLIPAKYTIRMVHSILIDANLLTFCYLLILGTFIWFVSRSDKWYITMMFTLIAFILAKTVMTLFTVLLIQLIS